MTILDLFKGNTPLHFSIKYNRPNIVKMLITSLEVDVNMQNKEGDTPLHIAIASKNKQLAHLLVEHGAQTSNIKNAAGLTCKKQCEKLYGCKLDKWVQSVATANMTAVTTEVAVQTAMASINAAPSLVSNNPPLANGTTTSAPTVAAISSNMTPAMLTTTLDISAQINATTHSKKKKSFWQYLKQAIVGSDKKQTDDQHQLQQQQQQQMFMSTADDDDLDGADLLDNTLSYTQHQQQLLNLAMTTNNSTSPLVKAAHQRMLSQSSVFPNAASAKGRMSLVIPRATMAAAMQQQQDALKQQQQTVPVAPPTTTSEEQQPQPKQRRRTVVERLRKSIGFSSKK